MKTKKKWIIIISLILFLLVFWFLPTNSYTTDPILLFTDNGLHRILKGKIPKYYNQMDCESAGGKWGKIGWTEECQFYSNDKGKKCFSGFQCNFGNCLSTSPTTKKMGLGKCSGELIPYNYPKIHFGVIEDIVIMK